MSLSRTLSGVLAACLLTTCLLATLPFAAAVAAPDKSAPPVIKSFGDWSTRCDQSVSNPAEKQCHAFIDEAADADEKTAPKKGKLFYIGVRKVIRQDKSEIMMFVTTPLGTVLPKGIGISVEDKINFGAPVSFCLQLGCQSDMLLSEEQIDALKTGKRFHLLFRLIGQGDLKIPVSLGGFSKAFASLPQPDAKPVKTLKP